jgi:hypothetical protein
MINLRDEISGWPPLKYSPRVLVSTRLESWPIRRGDYLQIDGADRLSPGLNSSVSHGAASASKSLEAHARVFSRSVGTVLAPAPETFGHMYT